MELLEDLKLEFRKKKLLKKGNRSMESQWGCRHIEIFDVDFDDHGMSS